MQHAEQRLKPHHSVIRAACASDVPDITAIYNDAIVNTAATFACRPRTSQEMSEWYSAHHDRHPVYVLMIGQHVAGWGSLSSWSLREGYRDTVEISVYLAPFARGCGHGGRMFDHLIEAARRLDHHCVICCHTVGNYSMETITASRGFSKVGVFEEIAFKFDHRHSLALWQLLLHPRDASLLQEDI
jgi:L-amino acid N-acyltransferase YncA